MKKLYQRVISLSDFTLIFLKYCLEFESFKWKKKKTNIRRVLVGQLAQTKLARV